MFSDPEVIRRVNADYVPVALKAALVNDPPDDEEGRLYREIIRSRIAPQGICVANSAGKALGWALMFDGRESIPAFLDHGLKRYRDHPDGARPVATERYMKFPSARLEDTPDSGRIFPSLNGHPGGKNCPARTLAAPGTVVARVIGRALGPDGKPLASTTSQEHYVEDRFSVPVPMQESLAELLANAVLRRVPLPDEFARLCVTHAYLGMLDVQPLSNPCGGKSDLRLCDFWAEELERGSAPAIWRVGGQSEVFTDEMANAGPGDLHQVRLTWEGFIELNGSRITRLLLSAQGREKLKFGSARAGDENAAASLPAGRRIDMECGVRYGIVGEPVGAVMEDPPPAYPDHTRLLVVRGPEGGEQPIKTPADWTRRREHILRGMEQAMGKLPNRASLPPLDPRIAEETRGDGFRRLKLTMVAEGADRIPAYLFLPDGPSGRRAPAMLALHQTTSIGKGEPAGLGGKANLRYGLELAERGYVVLCPDYPSFGDYAYDFGKDAYASGTMKGIWNHLRCVDFLLSRPEVDPERIGVIGHSLGGHNALFAAVFDERLQVVVSSCGWTPFHDYKGGKIEGWTSDRYMPRLKDIYGLDPDRVPFDFQGVSHLFYAVFP